MTSITNPTFFMPLSPSDTCLLSLPYSSSIFALKTSHQSFSISTKPIKLRLSSPRPRTHFSSVITHVAQTSDWPQQDEEEEEEEEEEGGPTWGNEDGAGEEVEEDGGYVEPPEEAKIFVGNLPYDLDSQRLAELFENSGTVEIAEVIYNRETDSSRGFGFVTMSTVEEAEKAVEQMNQYEIGGRSLTVTKAAPRGTRAERPARDNDSGYNIYVGNIPWDIDNGRLEQVFSEHGKVVSAKVIYDRETGRSRGFGFVSMASETEMNDAIAALDGQNLDGRSIRVNVAETRPRRVF